VTISVKEVCELALETGRIMLQNGGTTNRCEKMMTTVCAAYGYQRTESFVTPTGIFLTVLDKDNNATTQIKRIEGRRIDLGKVSKLSSIIIELKNCGKKGGESCDYRHLMAKLKEVDSYNPWSEWVKLFFGGMTSGCFCLLFGGSWAEFAVAYAVGILVSISMRLIVLLQVNNFLLHALGAALVVVFAKILDTWVPGIKLDNIIIGGIMLLVPGLAITNAIRDTMSGDLVSGTARGVEAFLLSVAIAAGSGSMLKIWALVGY